ncbi:hypothetical protein [Kitasatospora herbaricolor]|uniref:Uncharacterized protein n=1 Tax=Kitasatospora herbaricolor TaxID=68217 RepID=A0ABZ1WLR4_9ACTN|nr:hypothetical protein [Kitasatospora herbaricolor]
MALNISAVVLLAVLAVFMVRTRRTTPGAAITCALFGFLLAATGLAPVVNSTLAALATAVAGLG